MDREIPKEEIAKERRRLWSKIILIAAGATALAIWGMSLLSATVNKADLKLGQVDTGTLETTVTASGRVVPAFEEIINSPISTRIIEVYSKVGDSVSAGTPLLRLDLQSAETEMHRLTNEHSISQIAKEKSITANNSSVSNLKMQISVKEMEVEKLHEDMINEQRLDSIGSGTGERIRQARLAYKTAELQLEQLRLQLENAIKVQQAEIKEQDLNISISAGNIDKMERILSDAQVKAPRAATLTYIVNEIGRRVAEGEKLAVIADLKHFKVEGEISDAHAQKFGTGSKTIVEIGKNRYSGIITNVEPLSQGGIIKFTVTLDNDDSTTLRSGQSTNTYILTDIKEDVLRIPFGPYYMGPGPYKLFVKDGNKLQRRDVDLGESNYEYVEVISGLEYGEEVAVNDMKKFQNNKTLKINQ